MRLSEVQRYLWEFGCINPFQQNSGMLRQTVPVIFSQTASLLLMNAAGRVSVSPAEITVSSANTCPL